MNRAMKRARLMGWGAAIIGLFVVVELTTAARRTNRTRDDEIPLVEVKRGEFNLDVYTTGELRANHSTMLTAPPVGEGALAIIRLLHSGTPVKKGDLVIEFDPSEQRYKLEQSRSELLEAEQDIIKADSDRAVEAAQDQLALVKARYALRRAELEVQKNELVSAIDASKNRLALEQARRALAELEQDVNSHARSSKASRELAREKWNKAKLAMDQAQENITKMRVVSPLDGLVAVEKNFGGEMFFEGISIPDYHVGDQADPGSAVAQVIDAREMELFAQVSERERSNIEAGQPAQLVFDALPGKVFRAKVRTAGAMVVRQFWSSDTSGKFDLTLALEDQDSRLRPGLTAQVVIQGEHNQNLLYIPRQAIFHKDGQEIAYVRHGQSFDPRRVKVRAENESWAVIEDLKVGEQVALMDPTVSRKAAWDAAAGIGGGVP